MKEERKMKNNVPSDFVWKCTSTKKEHRKDRAKGGIMIVIRKNLKEIKINELSNEAVKIKLKYNGRWRIVTLYSQEKK